MIDDSTTIDRGSSPMNVSAFVRNTTGLILASLILALLFGSLRALDPPPSAGAQSVDPPLSEAWSLVDTWVGEGESAPGSVLSPAGIDIDGKTVWLVDAGNNRVQAFDSDGAFVRSMGRLGSDDGELSAPQDIAVAGGIVFVTDRGNSRIARFGVDGSVDSAWSHPELESPWGIAAAGDRVYVSAPELGEIFVFESGSVVARWSGFNEPRGMDVGPSGDLWVAEYGASTVAKVSPSGTVVDRFETRFAPTDIGVDERSDLYIQTGDSILWYEAGADRSSLAMYYLRMRGVAVSSGVGVLATVASDERLFHGVAVFRWRPREGLPEREWPLLGYPRGRLNDPMAIHSAPDGRLWITDGWPRAQAFSSRGRAELQYELPGPAVDIAVAPSGQIVAAERSRLHRLLPDGTVSGTIRLRRGGRDFWITGIGLEPSAEQVRLLDAAPGTAPSGIRAVLARRYGITDTLRPTSARVLIDVEAEPWELLWDLEMFETASGAVRTYVVNRMGRTIDVFEDDVLVTSWTTDGIPIRLDVGSDGVVFVLTTDGIVWKHNPGGNIVAGWDASAFSAGETDVVDLAVDDAGRVYTLDRAANTVRVWAVDPDGEPDRPISRAGACRVRGDKRAAPASIRLGEPVTVTLDVGGECPDTAPRADIVLAIDRSGSMNENGGITATRAAALDFLDGLDLSEDRIAVVAFNNTPQLVLPLSADATAARGAIASLTAIGGTDLAGALDMCSTELFGERRREDAKPVIVFLTDGRPVDGPDETLAAAERAKARGARIFMIGFGDTDPMIMALSASTPEDAYFAADPATLAEIYAEIASRISADVLAKTLSIIDILPADMRFRGAVEGPDPTVTGSTLRWELTDVPFGGVRLAFRVEPQTLGVHPTNVEASAEFIDGLEREGRLRFPVPEVEVLALNPTPTPTLTPFPTATPTPNPPKPIFLPLVVDQSCQDEAIGTDVVLVMDNSGSMNDATREDGPTKMEAALNAAQTIIERMRPSDRAAIVVFHDSALLVQELTGDTELLSDRLSSIETESGTRIDLGLREAIDELEGKRKVDGNTRVIALLTDGKSSIEDEIVLEVAVEAGAVTDRLFVIGLGSEDELDVGLLKQIATLDGDFYIAPTADELAAIYAEIALSLECAKLNWP